MKLRTRLQRLERLVVSDRGCAACRHRRERIALANVTQHQDGSVTYLEDAPLPCSACGQIPELIVEIMTALADSPATACDSVPAPGASNRLL